MYRASNWGRGICIDTIQIVTDSGVVPRLKHNASVKEVDPTLKTSA